MSGRRRTIPLDDILARATLVLVVDMGSRVTAQRTTVVKVGLLKRFDFEHAVMTITPTQVLRNTAGRDIPLGTPMDVVSEDTRRSKHWNVRRVRDGVRKIMYYDTCPAFDAPITSEDTALLVLDGFDDALQCWNASMGEGLLDMRYAASV